MHPLDQFRAFQTLHLQGLAEEEIAARYFVSVSTVRQRLRLASVCNNAPISPDDKVVDHLSRRIRDIAFEVNRLLSLTLKRHSRKDNGCGLPILVGDSEVFSIDTV
ncbi:hypothetical protein [Ensifer sesbaniae]|uniref:hypothetical protein n=1 Tax=Ensifer sesbaniae TaxID=1214071 RepID=UPI001569F101|nr:hypothetical protein [Ensifer sesbaniae]NRQ19012.1 hypothetical protein [Ensifer sesbaniae]